MNNINSLAYTHPVTTPPIPQTPPPSLVSSPMEDATLLQDFEDSEDALSFCDLPIHTHDSLDDPHPSPPEGDDFFQFFSEPIVVSGRSESFSAARSRSRPPVIRSESLRFPTPRASNQPGSADLRMASVKRSKKHAFLLGSAKFPLEMELNDMRRRQNRRAPVPIVPVAEAREATAGGKGAGKVGRWGLIRLLRCRSGWAKAAFGCVSPLL